MSSRILVVDDSLTIRRALELILEPEGYELRLAASGKEALEIAHAFDPELILLDYVLPDMRGPDVCAALEEIPHTQNTPVVLVSAKGTSIRQAYQDARNVVSYITKPFKPQVILSVVAHALAENRRAPESRSLPIPSATLVEQRGGLQSVEIGFRHLLESLEETASFAIRRDLEVDRTRIADLLRETVEQVGALHRQAGRARAGIHLSHQGEVLDPGAKLIAAHKALCQASLLLARCTGEEMAVPAIPSRIFVSTYAETPENPWMDSVPADQKPKWFLLDRKFEILPHLAALLQPEVIVLEGPPDEILAEALRRIPQEMQICYLGSAENRDAIDENLPCHQSPATIVGALEESSSAPNGSLMEVVEL